MKVDKEKNEKKENRILARRMSKEISEEQLKKVGGAGTCTVGNDGDLQEF